MQNIHIYTFIEKTKIILMKFINVYFFIHFIYPFFLNYVNLFVFYQKFLCIYYKLVVFR